MTSQASHPSADVSALLRAWSGGDAAAGDRLAPLIYDDLRRVARNRLRAQVRTPTLCTTDLVHETYVRLLGQRTRFENRLHFFALAAGLMRRVLVDLARRKNAAKRGAAIHLLSIDDVDVGQAPRSTDLLALDRALQDLATFDPIQARVVELRFFGGLSSEEVASVLAVSLSTVNRDWRVARLWLLKRLGGSLARS